MDSGFFAQCIMKQSGKEPGGNLVLKHVATYG